MASCLVVSLSGLSDASPESLHRGAEFAAALDERGVPVCQLLRPHGAVAAQGSRLRDWLDQRLAGGDALVLHGHDHTPDPTGARTSVGRRAEFAALPRHEAGLRLLAARRRLTALGLRTDTFIPPRWLASAGTVEALAEQGFVVCADEAAVRVLSGPAAGTVTRARVLGFRASGERRALAEDRRAVEAWRARVLVAEVVRTARRDELVRIAVRAKDLKRAVRVDAVLAAVDAALALGAQPSTYRGLVTPAHAA